MASSREYLLLVEESALNVPVASPIYWPTASANAFYIRLTDSNAWGMYTAPVFVDIPYGGGLAITADTVCDHYECKGSLKTMLYPQQAAFLMNWICTRINGAQTSPWTTTEPPGDLASVSAYHAVQRADGTYKLQRFGGVKVNAGTIAVSRASTVASLSLELTGCRSWGNAIDGTVDPLVGEFPVPADTAFPTGPYVFKQTAGALTVGSVVVGYEDLNINFANVVDGRWLEASYLQVNQFCGRASKLDASIRFKTTPDYQTAMEALTAQAVSIGFNNGVTNQNLLIQFNGQNRLRSLPYDTPLDAVHMRKLELMNQYDLSAGQDISFTMS